MRERRNISLELEDEEFDIADMDDDGEEAVRATHHCYQLTGSSQSLNKKEL